MFNSNLLMNCVLFWASILTAIFAASGRIPIIIPVIIVIITIIYTVCFINCVEKKSDNDLSEEDIEKIERKLIEYLRDKDAH